MKTLDEVNNTKLPQKRENKKKTKIFGRLFYIGFIHKSN